MGNQSRLAERRVWDAASGDELARFRHDGIVRTVSFSADGNRLVTASEDATARIWDLRLLRLPTAELARQLCAKFGSNAKSVAALEMGNDPELAKVYGRNGRNTKDLCANISE